MEKSTTLFELKTRLLELQGSPVPDSGDALELAREAISDLEAVISLLQNGDIIQIARRNSDRPTPPQLDKDAVNINIFDGVSDYHGYGGSDKVNVPYHVDG